MPTPCWPAFHRRNLDHFNQYRTLLPVSSTVAQYPQRYQDSSCIGSLSTSGSFSISYSSSSTASKETEPVYLRKRIKLHVPGHSGIRTEARSLGVMSSTTRRRKKEHHTEAGLPEEVFHDIRPAPLEQTATEQPFHKHQTIFQETTQGTSFYFVVSCFYCTSLSHSSHGLTVV